MFYHPPNFDELHKNRSRWQEVKDIDFGGVVLFCAGLILFLLGLSWGGSAYPWGSAHVIATLVVGFCVCVLFVLYGEFELSTRLCQQIDVFFRNLHASQATSGTDASIQRSRLLRLHHCQCRWRHVVLLIER